MIDAAGYRANVGIIITNANKKVLWCRRAKQKDAWQFPQGGIQWGETPMDALYREMQEELGLAPKDVKIIAESAHWFSYDLPLHFRRYDLKPLCIGQKQRWFLLELIAPDGHVRLDSVITPEFDAWQWVDYWYPLTRIIAFKRQVYQQALTEFATTLGIEPAT